MDGFQDMFKVAAHIKSTQLDQDKRKFDSLPEYAKSGLYYSSDFNNVRKQNFELKKIAFENLRFSAKKHFDKKDYDEAHHVFCKV
jgi:hypothetical protein